jgi:cobalt-precorrin 5A hydrolase / precorrin-3B C17-methyltransferase
MKPVIFVLGPSAIPLAENLRQLLDGELHGPAGNEGADLNYQSATTHLANVFQQGRTIIALCATGIVVRALAPHLHDKQTEPPVVVVSENGASVVPLLGGHHGANDIAINIARHLKAHAAITTASDVRLGISLDEPPPGYVLSNHEEVKRTAAHLLAGQTLAMSGTADWLAEFASRDGTVKAPVSIRQAEQNTLTFHPKTLVVGVGCERGTTPDELAELVLSTLTTHNLAPQSVACFATIDLKEDETAINALGPVRFFSTKELNAESHRVLKPSEIVRAEVGTPSVAEAAALACAGTSAKLIVAKTKSKRATCAIAEATLPILEPIGRTRGILHVIGLGPGAPSMRSPEASLKLSRSTDWVGYDLYLELAMDIYSGQVLYKFPLGAEEARVRHAIILAKQGKRVSLVCSGDAGIYAMASLVYEVIALEPCRIAVDVVPGISAFQAAAARAGALIGHDFCCISLSDLLTPWPAIENRIKAAAFGDFVVAFYNPRSVKRHDQLTRAIEILQLHRREDTPVIVASNLGRPEENIRIVRLDAFDATEIDMLTVVLVGSSQSKTGRRGDGSTFAFTPRGYEKKRQS